MGLLLIFLVISLIISVLVLAGEDVPEAVITFGVCFLIFSVISLIISGISYNTYIGLKQSLVTIEQYEQEVKLYINKGVVEFDKANMARQSLTDLKYQSYQKELSEKIYYLRNKISSYNNTLISKRELDNNWMFNWLIVAPDSDMMPLKMVDSNDRIVK